MSNRKEMSASTSRTAVWFPPGSEVPNRIAKLGELLVKELPASLRSVPISAPKIVEIAIDEALAKRERKGKTLEGG